MSWTGLLVVFGCALSASLSNLFLRWAIERVGTFSFNFFYIFNLFISPLFLVGLFFYGVTGLLWMKVLATEKLSIAYPLLISTAFILVTTGAVLFFDEQMTLTKISGFMLMIIGISLVSR
jgi:multidrug transporter EmrE-like cation transporter